MELNVNIKWLNTYALLMEADYVLNEVWVR